VLPLVKRTVPSKLKTLASNAGSERPLGPREPFVVERREGNGIASGIHFNMSVAFVARLNEAMPGCWIKDGGIKGASLGSGDGRELVVINAVELRGDMTGSKVQDAPNIGRVL
jgi:hypothetical protein